MSILKYVDDYLIIANKGVLLNDIQLIFNNNADSLSFTVENPNELGKLQFLDLELTKGETGICWCYKQKKR